MRKLVNRVSVEASFFKKMSAAENLSYAARYYGMTSRQTRGEIPRILDRVGFPSERRNESMENLSRGMQQKVALARALLTSPVLLLLDEPTTGLDPRSKLEVQKFIREIRETHESTILLCTHDLAEAEALADRVGILDRGRAALPAARRRAEAAVRRRDAGGGVLRRHRPGVRGGDGRRRRRAGGVRMKALLGSMRAELVGAGGVVERNAYLTKRYIWWDVAWFVWTVANTLTIVFIAKGIEASGGTLDVDETMTTLLIGAVVWAYLGILFAFLMETVAWERWEGTIEYTFMAPLSRAMHLAGQGVFAIIYGLIRALFLYAVCAFLFFDLAMPDANYVAAFVILVISSISFIGIGMMMSVLPLISPEKGTQLGFVAQGTLLVVSGVYYPVSVLPEWMQWLAKFSPATYALNGIRAAIIDGAALELAVERHLADAPHRRHLDPARALDIRARRAVREAARKAQAKWLSAPSTSTGSCKTFVVPEREAGLRRPRRACSAARRARCRRSTASRSTSSRARSSASSGRTAPARRRR